MKTTVVSHQSGTVRLQIDIDIHGSLHKIVTQAFPGREKHHVRAH